MSEPRNIPCPHCQHFHDPAACALTPGTMSQSSPGKSNIIPFRRNPQTRDLNLIPDHEPDGPTAA